MRILTFLITLVICSETIACSCFRATDEEYFNSSKRVFLGIVVSAELPKEEHSDIKVKVKVLDVYKGNVTSEITIFTGKYVASCGFGSISVNGTYLFFMNDEDVFYTCSGTRQMDQIMSDEGTYQPKLLQKLKKLGNGA